MNRFVVRVREMWQAASTRQRLVVGVLALFAFFVMAAVGAWTRACANNACPAVQSLAGFSPDQASKVYAADGRLLTDFGMERRTVMPLSQMSPAIPAAFLAIEDKRFYQHHGIDWVRFFGTIKNSLIHGGLSQGFSTITMQLAGNVFPEEIDRTKTGIRGIPRKIREVHVAMAIEKQFTKNQILEIYLNQINLGNRAFGVETAAERYFGKSARDLNVAEAATLAAIPKAPATYNPRRHPDYSVERRNLVIDAMRDDGRLTAAEAEQWKAYPLQLSARSDYEDVGAYFTEYVRQLLEPIYGEDLYKQGYRIYTTLDLDAQIAAERALRDQLEHVESSGRFPHETYQQYHDKKGDEAGELATTPYLQGGALVLDARTGNILAMVGGRDFNDSKFNRMTQAQRQPGSAFKPIMYSAAIESGAVTFDDKMPDAPITVDLPPNQTPPTWSPANYEGTFTDSMLTVREGLWRSLNSIAVRVGLKVGVLPVIAEARRFGITTPIDSAASIFLGSASVIPMELISSYSTFANLGTRVTPNAILRVEDRHGKIVQRSEVHSYPVLDPKTAWTMNQALQGVVKYGTASDAVWGAGFHVPAGGKTGTTNDFHDAWYIGFTPDIVAGMWVGFDNPQSIKEGAQGGYIVAPAWTRMMLDIYARRPEPADWVPPAEMQSGRLPGGSVSGGQ